MPAYNIVRLTDSRIAVSTPYHPEMVDRVKRLMGRWDSVNRVWVLRVEHEGRVREICELLWPPEDQKLDRVYKFHTDDGCSVSTAPTIDGLELLRFGRDSVGHIRHPDVIEVLENSLTSGGSMKHPTLRGTLVVRARVRPQAKAKWSNAYAEIVSDTADRLIEEVFGDEK